MTDTVRYLGLRVHAMAVKRVMFSILMDIASKRINQRIKIVNSSFMGNAENALIVTISMRTGIASRYQISAKTMIETMDTAHPAIVGIKSGKVNVF